MKLIASVSSSSDKIHLFKDSRNSLVELYTGSNNNEELLDISSPYGQIFPQTKSYKDSTGGSKSTCLGSMSIDMLNAQVLEDMLYTENKEVESTEEKFDQTLKLDLSELGINKDEIKQSVRKIKIKSIIPASSFVTKPSIKYFKDIKIPSKASNGQLNV